MDEAGITFEQAAAMFAAAPKPLPVFWRLYYDAEGKPITYSMEELPGNYIDIDAATYQRGPLNVRVVDGELKYIKQLWSQKLVPGTTGTPCHYQDVAVVVNEQPQYWSRKLYESYED